MRSLAVPFLVLVAFTSAPALASDPAALVKANCSGCHGPGGKGDSDAAVSMKAPQITGESAGTIVAAVKGSSAHQETAEALSDADLKAIGAYLSEQ